MSRRRATTFGSVRKLPSGRYQARWQTPDGDHHSTTFAHKADATAWLAAQQTDQGRGVALDHRRARVTVDEWAATWLATTVHLKPKTRVGYDSILRTHVLPSLGATKVAAIDRPRVDAFIAGMVASGAAPGTVRATRKVLRLVLETAVNAKALPANPCAGVKVPRSAKAEMHFLTADQVADLAQAIAHPERRTGGQGAAPWWRTEWPEYAVLVRFAAYTGLRAGELEALRVKRLDLLRGRVEVAETVGEVTGHGLVFGPTKTDQTRTVPLPRFLCDDLGTALVGKGGDDFVFPGPEGGPLRHRNFYARHFKQAVRQAGLPDTLRFHDLRHTFAGLLIAEGAHPRALMERMGHSSITVTLGTYGHLLPGLEQALTEALDRAGRAAQEAVSESAMARGWHATVTPLRQPGTS